MQKHPKISVLVIKLVVLVFISILFLFKNFNDYKIPFVSGDGFEYVLATEGLANHGTPDIRLADLYSLKEKASKRAGNWESFPKSVFVDDLIKQFEAIKPVYGEHIPAFYVSKTGKWYSFHFWAYSLINVPAYAIMSGTDPVTPFYITNSIMIILTCIVVLFYSSLNPVNSILATLCFCFSPVYWYLNWTHTEVFTMCFVLCGLIFYFREKYYTGLFLISIACTQNQPLALFLVLLALNALIKNGISIKHIFKTGIACIAVIIPSVFFYINFGTTNLIKDAGYLDNKYITLNRVFGFYFDFNQGMILAIPLLLLCFMLLYGKEIYLLVTRKQKLNFIIFVPLVILIMSIVVSAMNNWNHGMAIVNRYATWMAIIIMVITFYLSEKVSGKIPLALFCLYFVSQLATTLYYQQFNNYDWSYLTSRPMATWALRHHEKLYYPDPNIFITRYHPDFTMDEKNSPFIYFYKHQPKKILVHKNRMDSLIYYGLTKNTIEHLKQKASYNFDWAYINTEDFKSASSDERLFEITRQRKIKATMEKLKSWPDRMSQVQAKALQTGATPEEVLEAEAAYMVDEREKQEE